MESLVTAIVRVRVIEIVTVIVVVIVIAIVIPTVVVIEIVTVIVVVIVIAIVLPTVIVRAIVTQILTLIQILIPKIIVILTIRAMAMLLTSWIFLDHGPCPAVSCSSYLHEPRHGHVRRNAWDSRHGSRSQASSARSLHSCTMQ